MKKRTALLPNDRRKNQVTLLIGQQCFESIPAWMYTKTVQIILAVSNNVAPTSTNASVHVLSRKLTLTLNETQAEDAHRLFIYWLQLWCPTDWTALPRQKCKLSIPKLDYMFHTL